MPDGESDEDSRLEASLELLGEVLRLGERLADEVPKSAKKELGSIKHIYSHINAMFYCRLLDLPGEKAPRIQAEWKARAKWVDEVEVDNANISTGHGKVWTLVNNDSKDPGKNTKSGPPTKRKPAVKKEEKGQMKLSFGRKSVTVTEQDDLVAVAKSETIIEVAAPALHNDEVSAPPTPRKKRRIDISSDEEE